MAQAYTGGADISDMPAVHRVFRSSLAAGADFIGSAAGDSERRSLIANYYLNLIEFLKVHHDGEEVLVFPLLSERAPERHALLHEAEQQHADVVNLMAAVKVSMADWETTGDAKAPQAVKSLQALDEVLIPHLDQEELAILPLAHQFLDPEEWGKLPGHSIGHFAGDKVWLILGLIRENFTQQQRDSMLEHMPAPARHMWESTGEAAFQSLISQVRTPVSSGDPI